MKKKAILTSLFSLSLLLLVNNGFTQTKSPQQGMVMSLSMVQEGLVLEDAVPFRVNTKAMRDFNKSFNGKQANWNSSGDVFQAKFSDEKIRTVVGYSKYGRWLYTIKHYSEKEMPGDVRHMVKREYYDYKIDLINEVRVPLNKNKVYIIHIHNDDKQHKILRYADEEIHVVKTYSES